MTDLTYIKIQAIAKALTDDSYEMNSIKMHHCEKGSALSLIFQFVLVFSLDFVLHNLLMTLHFLFAGGLLFEQTDSDGPVLIRFEIFSRVFLFGFWRKRDIVEISRQSKGN